MIKCEVIKEFTLGKFDELKNIKRKRIDTKGKLYEGDTFECTEEMYKYLTGTNDKGITVVKVIEVVPEKTQFKKDMEFLANTEIDGINCLEATYNAIQKTSEKMKTTKKKKSSKK